MVQALYYTGIIFVHKTEEQICHYEKVKFTSVPTKTAVVKLP